MASLETTLAAAAARDAAAAWKRHVGGCARCQKPGPHPRCDPGLRAHADHIDAAREAAAAKLADRRPIPGQGALFA